MQRCWSNAISKCACSAIRTLLGGNNNIGDDQLLRIVQRFPKEAQNDCKWALGDDCELDDDRLYDADKLNALHFCTTKNT